MNNHKECKQNCGSTDCPAPTVVVDIKRYKERKKRREIAKQILKQAEKLDW